MNRIIKFLLYKQGYIYKMEELLGNKLDQLLEKFTSMETIISLLHTELSNMKEDK